MTRRRHVAPLGEYIRVFILIIVGLFLCSPATLFVQAAAGDLDHTFGNAGLVVTEFPADPILGGDDKVRAVVLAPDGKILVVGDNRKGILLARYNPDGNLDHTFGSGGKVDARLFAGVIEVHGAALAVDGKIVVVGLTLTPETDADFALARFNSDGGVDFSFGSRGGVTTDFNNRSDLAYGMALQPDGKIVAAGWRVTLHGRSEFALARYSPDGSLDTTFGSGGKVTTNFTKLDSLASAVALQPDGKIIVVGQFDTGEVRLFRQLTDFAIVRYNTDGALDTSFGSGGMVTTDIQGLQDAAAAVAIQADGKIVVVGTADDQGGIETDWAIARYNRDGTLDRTFGSKGRVTTDFGNHRNFASAMALQPNGRIVVAGTSFNEGQGDRSRFIVARYNEGGSLDSRFGTAGHITTSFNGRFESANALAIQPDGKIFVAGVTCRRSDFLERDFALARYESSSPRIGSVSLSGKNLLIFGEEFDSGAIILLNGVGQKTRNENNHPDSELIGKQTAKRIAPGQTVMLQVKNADGALSPIFPFTRPAG